MIKPGAIWEEIQIQMHRVLAASFLRIGLFTRGQLVGTEEEIIDQLLDLGLTIGFYPHGVGHLLGLDVHDGQSSFRALIWKILMWFDSGRIARGKVEGSAVQISEIGRRAARGGIRSHRRAWVRPPLCIDTTTDERYRIYFNDHLLAEILDSPHLDRKLLDQYKYVGGVRIEDKYVLPFSSFLPPLTQK